MAVDGAACSGTGGTHVQGAVRPCEPEVLRQGIPQSCLPACLPACLLQVFGGKVVRAPCGVMHGKTSLVWHTNVGLVEVRRARRAGGQAGGRAAWAGRGRSECGLWMAGRAHAAHVRRACSKRNASERLSYPAQLPCSLARHFPCVQRGGP